MIKILWLITQVVFWLVTAFLAAATVGGILGIIFGLTVHAFNAAKGLV